MWRFWVAGNYQGPPPPAESGREPRSEGLHQEWFLVRCQVMDADSLEIWLIAGLLVDEHGSRAIAVAKARAERALASGDRSENAVWRAVAAAAERYLRDLKPAGPPREFVGSRGG